MISRQRGRPREEPLRPLIMVIISFLKAIFNQTILYSRVNNNVISTRFTLRMGIEPAHMKFDPKILSIKNCAYF